MSGFLEYDFLDLNIVKINIVIIHLKNVNKVSNTNSLNIKKTFTHLF
jgi:hypothetical protein